MSFAHKLIEFVINIYWIEKVDVSLDYKCFLYEQLSSKFSNYPEIRLHIIDKMIKLYKESQLDENFPELGMCYLHKAAIIIDFLDINNLSKSFNMCASDIAHISHNVLIESVSHSHPTSLKTFYGPNRVKVLSQGNKKII